MEDLLQNMPLQPPPAGAPLAISSSLPLFAPQAAPPAPQAAYAPGGYASYGQYGQGGSREPSPPARSDSPTQFDAAAAARAQLPAHVPLVAQSLEEASRSMAERSAELSQHIALVMSQLPQLPPSAAQSTNASHSASPDRAAYAQLAPPAPASSAGYGAPQPGGGDQAAVAAHRETPPAIKNPLYNTSRSPSPTWQLPQQLAPVAAGAAGADGNAELAVMPEGYGELVSKIRVTETRLQEAISSLTDATRAFKQAQAMQAAKPNTAVNGQPRDQHAMGQQATPAAAATPCNRTEQL